MPLVLVAVVDVLVNIFLDFPSVTEINIYIIYIIYIYNLSSTLLVHWWGYWSTYCLCRRMQISCSVPVGFLSGLSSVGLCFSHYTRKGGGCGT